MLVKAAKKDIEQYMDFAYSLAMDQTKSGYPLWSDGISTKEEFVDFVWKSYRNEDRDILLFVIDGVVEGWIQPGGKSAVHDLPRFYESAEIDRIHGPFDRKISEKSLPYHGQSACASRQACERLAGTAQIAD